LAPFRNWVIGISSASPQSRKSHTAQEYLFWFYRPELSKLGKVKGQIVDDNGGDSKDRYSPKTEATMKQIENDHKKNSRRRNSPDSIKPRQANPSKQSHEEWREYQQQQP
jgi:hypothetical protein